MAQLDKMFVNRTREKQLFDYALVREAAMNKRQFLTKAWFAIIREISCLLIGNFDSFGVLFNLFQFRSFHEGNQSLHFLLLLTLLQR